MVIIGYGNILAIRDVWISLIAIFLSTRQGKLYFKKLNGEVWEGGCLTESGRVGGLLKYPTFKTGGELLERERRGGGGGGHNRTFPV